MLREIKECAGLIIIRRVAERVEVLLQLRTVRDPGYPKIGDGTWETTCGGRHATDRDLLETATREAAEECGFDPTRARFIGEAEVRSETEDGVTATLCRSFGDVSIAGAPIPWAASFFVAEVDPDWQPCNGDGEVGAFRWIEKDALKAEIERDRAAFFLLHRELLYQFASSPCSTAPTREAQHHE